MFKISIYPVVTLVSMALFHNVGVASEQVFISGKQQTTLVELFTSQGCSSCPPAERWLGSLVQDPNLWKEIVPMAFHVDYWDYISWRDTYAKPEYTARQQRYRSDRAIRSVYTPSFVVNGQEWRGWFSGRTLPTINKPAGELQARVNDSQLQADFKDTGSLSDPLTLNVALLGVGLQVDVNKGENMGRRLSQDFVVLRHLKLTSDDRSWKTTLPEIDLPAGTRSAIAIWVSAEENQRPLQAVGGWLE